MLRAQRERDPSPSPSSGELMGPQSPLLEDGVTAPLGREGLWRACVPHSGVGCSLWAQVGSLSLLVTAVPRTLYAGVTPHPVRMAASAGRPTPCTAVSATVAGLASTVTCPAFPVRWPHGSKVTGYVPPWPILLRSEAAPQEESPGLTLPAAMSPAGIEVTNLCRNGGLCMDAGNTHHCRCQAGYTGSYCEDQVDECSPSPCQNGATCTDYPGGYSCEVGTHPG